MKKLVWMLLPVVVAACSTQSTVTLVGRSDRQIVHGTADWLRQEAALTLNGVNYRGEYVLTPAPQTTVVVNNQVALNDKKAQATRASSSSSVQRAPNGTGKMLLISPQGDTLRCEFTYEESLGMKAIGTCTDNRSREYDLRIATAF
jgi:hypothetical protein